MNAYIAEYKETISDLLKHSNGQYTRQMAMDDYEGFCKELNESNVEEDIKKILKAFPLQYKFFVLYFKYVKNIDRDIEAYARLCGFDIADLINRRE